MAKKNKIKGSISNPLLQTFLIYISGGWVVIELSDYIINKYGFNEKISDILPIVLLIGVPITIFFAWYLSREKAEVIQETDTTVTSEKSSGIRWIMRLKPWVSISVIVILILIVITGVRYFHEKAKIKWALEEALPEMKYWIDDLNHVNAFQLRQQIKKYIPDNSEFKRIDSLITNTVQILTDPEGVDVFCKEYSHIEDDWTFIGITPIKNQEMPNQTLYRWKFQKKGYETVYAAAPTHLDTLFRTLHKTGTIPEGMVYVEELALEDGADFLTQIKNGFYIDKHEVTNQMFKEFIDHGGYQNPDYWENEFVLNDDTLTFNEAMNHFKDITDRPGPATWEAGDYPEGQGNYPVNGISWHEAAAYASYAGKNLPTYMHWQSAAGFVFDPFSQLYGSQVVPLSNMNGSGPEPVNSNEGISFFGSYDMAGNVREWCWNKSPSERIILGGAWNDESYQVVTISQMPSFNRSSKNGFRCVLYIDKENIPKQAFQPVQLREGNNEDYRFKEPVSESEFHFYKKQFQYDKTSLNSLIESRDDSNEDWILEKISFDAAYENEKMIAYLFLPKNTIPPYQTIIFFPGAYASRETSFMESNTTIRNIDYIVKNGRAVMFPIYKTTYERWDESYHCSGSSETHQYTECMVKVVKDFCRSIDYLETRKDIDTSRLGYLGDSWGARMGAIIPAFEDRLKLCVLIRGGLSRIKKFPEATEFNYVSHVTIPVLMLNGRYDFTFPYESTVVPMYDLLGTSKEHKKLVTYETEHYVPKSEIVKETLNWLDLYFGPVNH